MKTCTKAIVAVAGYGTRRLPISKAVEKCMVPLLNRPVVDYVVQDCVKAGVKDIYFVVSGDARQLRNYYERNMELEAYLERKGKNDLLEQITPPEGVTFHYITQDLSDGRYGTTIPVWLCRDYVEPDENVLVIMGDQTLYRLDGGSEMADLIKLVEDTGSDAGLVGNPIPWEQIASFGIIEKDGQGFYKRIVEHPSEGEVNTNLNNSSIYLFPGTFFELLDKQVDEKRISQGEYLIIDSVNDLVNQGGKVCVREATGEYLECGSLGNWVRANNWLFEHTQTK